MKKIIPKIQIGDVINSHVVEEVSPREFIVSLNGDLVRVVNRSLKSLETGQSVKVRVVGVNPLQFQLVELGRQSLNLKV